MVVLHFLSYLIDCIIQIFVGCFGSSCVQIRPNKWIKGNQTFERVSDPRFSLF